MESDTLQVYCNLNYGVQAESKRPPWERQISCDLNIKLKKLTFQGDFTKFQIDEKEKDEGGGVEGGGGAKFFSEEGLTNQRP